MNADTGPCARRNTVAGLVPLQAPGRLVLLFVALTLNCPAADSAAPATIGPIRNKVQYLRYVSANERNVSDAREGIPLAVRDRVRTFEDSAATILITGKQSVQLGELSSLEIMPQESEVSPLLELLQGALYFFSRDKPREVKLRTPHATGAPRGTEFALYVDDQRTLLAVYDGSATLSNDQNETIDLARGELGIAAPGQPLRKEPLKANSIIQWWIYYPGVLDANELELPAMEAAALAPSLEAYRAGDLMRALRLHPGYPSPLTPASGEGKVYLAALYLGAGQAAKAEALLKDVPKSSTHAAALRWVIRAVRGDVDERPEVHTSASEWLGLSYYYQARRELVAALKAARQAVTQSTNFGFGWERVAELEFSFGNTRASAEALERSLTLSPRYAPAHALQGFIQLAQGKLDQAEQAFDLALQLEDTLGDARLGRGLLRIHRRDKAGGQADLQMAAVLEPERSLFRSYLGKAFANAGQSEPAELELERAKSLDRNDPTPWLYSALLKAEQHRLNEAVADLEKSIALNDNRAVYRSRLLLDQDHAVRSANLAAIYADAGLSGFGLREASAAVTADYANYSSHLFLANSYNELRDPGYANLRYETATFSEYLLANLLSPATATIFSPQISQQEYSRLFDRQRLGFISETSYTSDGDWQQEVSQYGCLSRSAYALDGYYRTSHGDAANSALDQLALSAQFKYQLSLQDSVYLQIVLNNVESGDTRRYDDPNSASHDLLVREKQMPNLFCGYRHEWAPGVQTLLLAGWLNDSLDFNTTNVGITTLEYFNGEVYPSPWQFGADYQSRFDAISVELQQIWQVANNTVIAGGRFQNGETETKAKLTTLAENEFYFLQPSFPQQHTANLERLSFYAYDNWQILPSFLVSAGVSYDNLTFPENVDTMPISDVELHKERVSPKAGFIWTPARATTLRGAYTRSLGGLFFDQSVRLEPTQIAGFNQAFRSLIPESVAGSVPGSEFETWHLGMDQRFATGTYLVADAAILNSRADRTIGVFDSAEPDFVPILAQTPQELDYKEQSLALGVNQLVGKEWGFGARYRLSRSELDTRWPALPESAMSDTHQIAVLHEVDLFATFNHASGLFARVDALWWHQSNQGYSPALPGDEFWQFNVSAGYRFPRRRAEFAVGLLNISDQDYRLNPLSLYGELPRHRTLVARLRLNF